MESAEVTCDPYCAADTRNHRQKAEVPTETTFLSNSQADIKPIYYHQTSDYNDDSQ